MRLREENEKLKKMINVRVDSMAEQAEQDYTELIKKRDRMITDKTRIEKTITELDTERNKQLNITFNQVRKNMSNIFSTLLPGADA